MFLKKKLAISFIVIYLVALFSVPVLSVKAAINTGLSPEEDPICWTKQACSKARELQGVDPDKAGEGWVQNETPCDTEDGELGKCLAVGKTVTEISLGGQATFNHLGDYIKVIYNYALRLASILAVVVIIIAGAQWVTSGGNAESITSAKKRIAGAMMGLFIAFLSYFILQAVNPSLLSLRLPQVWMMVPMNPESMQEGDPCFTIENELACKYACPGCYCRPIQIDPQNFISDLREFTHQYLNVIGFLASGGAEAGAGVATKVGAKVATKATDLYYLVVGQIAKQGKNIPIAVIKAGWANRNKIVVGTVKSAAAGAGTVAMADTFQWLAKTKDPGKQGICMKMPKDLGNGELCDKNDFQCAEGLICVIPPGGLAGTCSNRGEGSMCQNQEDCGSGFVCEDMVLGIRQCVSYASGEKRITGQDCFSSNALCFSTVCGKISRKCIVGKEGVECGIEDKCADGYTCKTLGNYRTCGKN